MLVVVVVVEVATKQYQAALVQLTPVAVGREVLPQMVAAAQLIVVVEVVGDIVALAAALVDRALLLLLTIAQHK